MCFREVRQKDVQRSIFHRGYEESKIAYVNPPGAAERLPLILYKENPALDAGFRERYAFDQKSSES